MCLRRLSNVSNKSKKSIKKCSKIVKTELLDWLLKIKVLRKELCSLKFKKALMQVTDLERVLMMAKEKSSRKNMKEEFNNIKRFFKKRNKRTEN